MSKQRQSPNPEAARRFLERRDLAVLAEEPLRFEVTDKAASYYQILPCIACWFTFGSTLMCWPVSTCCPSKLMPHFSFTVSAAQKHLGVLRSRVGHRARQRVWLRPRTCCAP
jgi:hypothetical protein